MSAASDKQVCQVRALLATGSTHISGGSWVRDNGWERQRNQCRRWLRDFVARESQKCA